MTSGARILTDQVANVGGEAAKGITTTAPKAAGGGAAGASGTTGAASAGFPWLTAALLAFQAGSTAYSLYENKQAEGKAASLAADREKAARATAGEDPPVLGDDTATMLEKRKNDLAAAKSLKGTARKGGTILTSGLGLMGQAAQPMKTLLGS